MRPDAFLGTIVLCAVLTPAVVFFILRRWGELGSLTPRLWLMLYGLGALMCVIVLPRKHLESAIILRWPRSLWAYHLAQVDNELWEQLGKLAVILLALWLASEPMRVLFTHRRSAAAVGYWTGLAYGIGEAVILAVLFMWPSWAPLFGLRTFTPYTIGWGYVWERLSAVHLHAVMGALIGLGLYGLIGLGSRLRPVAFFALAMAYHHLVDGLIITAGFVPALAGLIRQAGGLFVPMLVLAGLVILRLAYRIQPAEGGSP